MFSRVLLLSSRRYFSSLKFTMGKTKKSFYAVRYGKVSGVYLTWDECRAQVYGYPGAVYKGFTTRSEAEEFCKQTGGYSTTARSRYAGSQSTRRKAYNSKAHSSTGDTGISSKTRQYSTGVGTVDSSSVDWPVVYSDGSCMGNGFKGAHAGLGVYWGDDHPHNVSEKLEGPPTNQRAELVSACRALETALEQGYKRIEVRTDSTYTIKAMTEWISKWKINGWRSASSGPVKNQEDIRRLDSLCQQVQVKWTHVRGHQGVPGNEAADRLARAGALK